MNEELEIFIRNLITELHGSASDDLRTSTLIRCLENAARETDNGGEDGPDEGDGPDWD